MLIAISCRRRGIRRFRAAASLKPDRLELAYSSTIGIRRFRAAASLKHVAQHHMLAAAGMYPPLSGGGLIEAKRKTGPSHTG